MQVSDNLGSPRELSGLHRVYIRASLPGWINTKSNNMKKQHLVRLLYSLLFSFVLLFWSETRILEKVTVLVPTTTK